MSVVPRIQIRDKYHKILLRDIGLLINYQETKHLNIIFTAFNLLLESISNLNSIKDNNQRDYFFRLTKHPYWKNDLFKKKLFKKLPISFYLDFLPSIFDDFNFGKEIDKSTMKLYQKIISSMKKHKFI